MVHLVILIQLNNQIENFDMGIYDAHINLHPTLYNWFNQD